MTSEAGRHELNADIFLPLSHASHKTAIHVNVPAFDADLLVERQDASEVASLLAEGLSGFRAVDAFESNSQLLGPADANDIDRVAVDDGDHFGGE